MRSSDWRCWNCLRPSGRSTMDIPPAVYSPRRLAALLRYQRHFLEGLAEEHSKFYRPFPKPRPGKEPRWIDNPIPRLKDVQTAIYNTLLKPIRLPDCIQGSVPGGSTSRNALRHVGKRLVVAMDVESCFTNITNEMVFKVWHLMLGHSPSVARLLTKLTTFSGYLPHGAPTSSALANLVLLPAVEEVSRKARPVGVEVGQYVDDQALSGDMGGLQLIGGACQSFSRIGLRVSRDKKKFRIMRSGKQQTVTGFVVNRCLGIPRKARAKIRAAVHELKIDHGSLRPSDREFKSVQARVTRLARFHPGQARLLQARLDALVP